MPFEADLSRPLAQQLAQRLVLTLNRTDDWDTQVGFRLVKETGAIRLFRLVTDAPHRTAQLYEFYGSATDDSAKAEVKKLYEPCLEAATAINGVIDKDRLIMPDDAIELSWPPAPPEE